MNNSLITLTLWVRLKKSEVQKGNFLQTDLSKFLCSNSVIIFLSFEAVPSEVDCEMSQIKVIEAVGKMIRVIEKGRSLERIVSTVETANSILAIIGADH